MPSAHTVGGLIKWFEGFLVSLLPLPIHQVCCIAEIGQWEQEDLDRRLDSSF